jgi:RimJ/RimL family protein N-acetyltransferase
MTKPRPHAERNIASLDCGKYLLRSLTLDDASDRWAGWMADPGNVRLLNAAPRTHTRADIVRYIEQFDQRTHLLIGIFEKQTGLHIGFFRLDIDPALKRGLLFMMIGERRYRHWSVTAEFRVPFQDYVFETLGLRVILATALASNRAMIRYMFKSGWSLDKTIERHVKSQADGSMLDLCFLSLSREAWRAWKQANLPQS